MGMGVGLTDATCGARIAAYLILGSLILGGLHARAYEGFAV
jgi:hypothetical protein